MHAYTLAVIASLAQIAQPTDTVPNPIRREILRAIQSPAFDIRSAAYDEYIRDRERFVKQLICLAAQKTQPTQSSILIRRPAYPHRETKHLALLLLAEMADPAATPVLLANIDYLNPKDLITFDCPDRGFYYPAAEALVRIGQPAMTEVVEKLATTQTSGTVRENCVWVLVQHYGIDLAEARLQVATKKQRDPIARENLRAALEVLSQPVYTKSRGLR